MIASRRLRIFGSATSSTRTSCLPNQQFAFMKVSLERRGKATSEIVVFPRRTFAAAGGLSFRRDGLAGFHDLFESAQIFCELQSRLFAEELRESDADGSG